MRRVIIGLSLALVAQAAVAAPAFPLGLWYAEAVENGLNAQFVLANKPDGTFVKKIRDTTDCDHPRDWIEAGSWTMEGDRYTEVTRIVEGQTAVPAYTDPFDIRRIDDDHLIMHDPATGVDWPLVRIPQDFTIPFPAHCGTS